MNILCFEIIILIFVYIQEGSIHRKRASFLDPNNTGGSLLAYFKMIRGFLLDPMHLIDGGVLKDFLKLICDRLEEIVPGMGCKQKVRVNKRLKQWIRVFNKTKILEICKFRLDDWQFKNYGGEMVVELIVTHLVPKI